MRVVAYGIFTVDTILAQLFRRWPRGQRDGFPWLLLLLEVRRPRVELLLLLRREVRWLHAKAAWTRLVRRSSWTTRRPALKHLLSSRSGNELMLEDLLLDGLLLCEGQRVEVVGNVQGRQTRYLLDGWAAERVLLRASRWSRKASRPRWPRPHVLCGWDTGLHARSVENAPLAVRLTRSAPPVLLLLELARHARAVPAASVQ